MNLANLNEELIKKFVRTISTGEILFKQNDLGNTMFIIVGGEIELLDNHGEKEKNYVVGTLGIG